MARIGYFDCFSGISGDMTLGALIDAGLAIDELRAELHKLNVGGWRIAAERVVRYGIAGTRLHVTTEEQHVHRHLRDIAAILNASALDADVQRRALAVFTRLAESEAAVHGTSRDEVHFHEVGALDAIIDIVGVVIGLKVLGIEQVYASALPLGSGWINAAHGRIPVPGPAVLHLLSVVNAPILPDTTPFELVTPTGAALLAEFAVFERPPISIAATGYGFGGRDTGRLNAVRLWVGESRASESQPENVEAPDVRSSAQESTDSVILLQTNLDDQPAEQIAYVVEQLLQQGALDVWWSAIGMKKNRGGLMLSALVRPVDESRIVDTIFRESTTLGVRRQPLERWICEREVQTIETQWGTVRFKEQRWRGDVLGRAPEYEDCAAIAQTHGIPLRQVYAAVQAALEAETNDE